MYAQYQSYQHQSNAAVQQQQQQALTWNGSAWVNAPNSAVQSSTYSSYEKPAKPVSIPSNPVATYTQYYHSWQAHGKACEARLRQMTYSSPAEKTEMQRQVDWAKYYADESSRAAHHFHQNPHAVSAPFDLPPAPPTTAAASSVPSSAPSTYSKQPQQQHSNTYGSAKSNVHNSNRTATNHSSTTQNQKNNSSSSSDNTGSLTRYVKRCLDQCSTADQRKLVQAEVEKSIAKAIQAGTLHSKNWDAEPLLRVPGLPSATAAESNPSLGTYQNNNRNMSTFSSSSSPPSLSNPSHSSSTAGHYGPASSSANITPDQNNNNNKYMNQYYGGGGNNQNNSPYGNGKNGYNQHHQHKNKFNKRYEDKLPENNSYYGTSGGGSMSSPTSMKQTRGAKDIQYGFGSHKKASKSQSKNNEASYYGPASSSFDDNHNSNLSPSLQKRTFDMAGDEDFIAFSQRKNKKQKKNHKQKQDSKGFEKSHQALAKRANRFSGPGGIIDASYAATSIAGNEQYMGKKILGGSQKVLDERDFEQMTVKGTCQTLEKEYLRLTAPPRAELVRPQPILERHLENLKDDYKHKRHEYLWFCSQFKAVRQDCTVQRIQNAFAVDVYETHAKIALQEGDLNEYNQCQTQLKELYDQQHQAPQSVGNREEFIAYRLLYYVFLSTNEKYDGGSSDMFKIMLSLTPEQRSNPAIAHALEIREAVASGGYLQFFRLHKKSPNLGRYLTERILPTMRLRALRVMTKAFRPSLELDVCLDHLGFESTEVGKAWLLSCGGVIEGSLFMTKDSTIHEPTEEKKNSLI